jgi:ATP-binding cassette, subfamily B, bacterial PglK
MNNIPTLSSLIPQLWHHLNKKRKRQIILVLLLMLVSAFTEVISLGAVLPFLAILISPETVYNQPYINDIAMYFDIMSPDELILPITIIFVLSALSAGFLRILLLWSSTKVTYGCGADLSFDIYQRTLYQPYQVHLSRNSSEMISSIINKVNNVTFGILLSLLNLLSSGVMLIALLSALIVIDPVTTFTAALGFGFTYGIISFISRRQLKQNSIRISVEQGRVVKALQEGIGGIRDVLLDGTQSVYCEQYQRSDLPVRQASGNNLFISQYPRYAMESVGITLIVTFAYYLSQNADGVTVALPLLGTFAFGAQRLLPALHQIYSSWACIVGTHASLADTIEMLEQPIPKEQDHNEVNYNNEIKFDNVSFRYSSDKPWVLKNINLQVPKGVSIGFVGTTGSGKSTSIDLFMGLLDPVRGTIFIDDKPLNDDLKRAWQNKIAHVPQNIFLADTTILQNIALGVSIENIDIQRVKKAAQQAQISEFIESSPEGYMGLIGERGIRLSGGQRQRIGIARALYKQASVLVFDEATSSLDNATEQSVINSISALNANLTIIMIAHRLTTIKYCDTIIEFVDGKIAAQGTYEQLLESSPSFRNMAFLSK